ncbi:MAG TPA: hypothetical protein VIV34_03535 [Pseudolabrys sp.]
MLKIMMIGTGLAAILASSAMAQSYQPEVGSGNIVPKQEYNTTFRSGTDAYAYERPVLHHHRHMDKTYNLDRD